MTRGCSTAPSRSCSAGRVASLITLAMLGLWVAPPDAVQGDAQRLMYVHVPAAWLAYLAFGVTALASVLYLWRRTRSAVWDRVAGASAELGVIFTGLCLVLGSLWGRPVWGTWWEWEARLVSTAVLFFLYVGYLALRRIPGPGRAKRCAIAALIAFVDVPIVHFSVEWWRTLHQQATVFNPDLDPEIHGSMAFTLVFGVLAFTLLVRVPARSSLLARGARGGPRGARARGGDRGAHEQRRARRRGRSGRVRDDRRRVT